MTGINGGSRKKDLGVIEEAERRGYMFRADGIVIGLRGFPVGKASLQGGHLLFNLGGKSYLVHRLIAAKFLPAPERDNMLVCHKDGNKQNNAANNLYYGTPKQNADDTVNHFRNNKVGGSKELIDAEKWLRYHLSMSEHYRTIINRVIRAK